jgi:hypothetical protein
LSLSVALLSPAFSAIAVFYNTSSPSPDFSSTCKLCRILLATISAACFASVCLAAYIAFAFTYHQEIIHEKLIDSIENRWSGGKK